MSYVALYLAIAVPFVITDAIWLKLMGLLSVVDIVWGGLLGAGSAYCGYQAARHLPAI